jgi:hypothetical protein
MRLSRIFMLIGALALPALPAAAQGKALGKPAGVGKPTTTTAKGPAVKGKSADAKSGTLAKGKSVDHVKGPKTPTTATDTATDIDTDTTVADEGGTKGRGQLPLGEKIALNSTLKARLDGLLAGSTLTYEQATTGWKNQGQLVAAMNAAKNNNLSFASLYTEVVTNQKKLPDAVTFLKPATTTTTTTNTSTTTTTTPPTTTPTAVQ